MPRIRLGSHTAFEFELGVHDSDDETLLRAQAWAADDGGAVWTARAFFFAESFLARAAPLLRPARYGDGLSAADRSALDERPLVSGVPTYVEHAYPGRVAVGETLWGDADVWVMPKRCRCTVDVAVSDDPSWRASTPLVVRLRDTDLHVPGEPGQKAPPFAYAVPALGLLRWGEVPEGATVSDDAPPYPPPLSWARTDERGEPQPYVRFAEAG